MNERNNLAEVGELGMNPLKPTSAPTLVEQAAIVLLSMGEEPAAAVLRCLSREELLEITQVMSRLSGIKVDSVKNALQHFFDDYREQSGVHGASRAFLKRSLDMALGKEIAGSVLNSIYGDAIRPKMARLQWASPKWLADYILQEHVRMQAVFVAFLPPTLASSVIDAMPIDSRDMLLLDVARLKEVDRDILNELDEVVTRCLANLGSQSASIEGIKQAAEILNRLPGNKQQMVELLRAHDPEVVSAMEVSMYDFLILSRQAEQTLLRIIEAVPPDQWAIALKGAEPSICNAILQTMPRRQAQGFEEMMRRTGPVPMNRIEQVRQDIMNQVKALADQGEIDVRLFAEEVVE